MARMPDARWLGENSPRNTMSRHDIVCVHTIVGTAPAHAAHFSTKADGTIQQSRDTRYQSAANLNGNHRVIAIENEDMGAAFPDWGGSNVPRLTDEQVEACGRILAWAHKAHKIPLQLCPDSRPGSRGLAYHRQGIDGNFGSFRFPGRVAGGEVWTEHFGKVCPGDNRIAQLPDILAVAKDIAEKDWFGMATQEDLQQAVKAGSDRVIARLDRMSLRMAKRHKVLLDELDALADEKDIAVIKARLKTIRQKVDAIPVDTDTEETP